MPNGQNDDLCGVHAIDNAVGVVENLLRRLTDRRLPPYQLPTRLEVPFIGELAAGRVVHRCHEHTFVTRPRVTAPATRRAATIWASVHARGRCVRTMVPATPQCHAARWRRASWALGLLGAAGTDAADGGGPQRLPVRPYGD
jgi:hypothetical protein